MKKIILSVVLIITAILNVSAQNKFTTKRFQNEGKNNLYLGKEQTIIAEGDLNKDGIKDLVIAENVDGEIGERVTAYFAIYWGGDDGVYKLYKTFQLDSLARQLNVSITERGVLRMSAETTYNEVDEDGESGYYEEYTLVYMLRYQDNEFCLIGGSVNYHWERVPDLGCRCYYISYNTLTNKAIRSDFPGCDTDHPEKSTVDIKKLPLMKLTEFPIGQPIFDVFNLR